MMEESNIVLKKISHFIVLRKCGKTILIPINFIMTSGPHENIILPSLASSLVFIIESKIVIALF
jgi:hypothetical protein